MLLAKDASLTVTARQRANAHATPRVTTGPVRAHSAQKAAARWKAMPDEQLWALVPSQELPRSIHATTTSRHQQDGALPEVQGGSSPSATIPGDATSFGNPWKITCPNPKCQAVFPGNDFGAYYRSALDEHGFFRRGKGDPSPLQHRPPRSQRSLHRAYVDDGYGWTDAEGTRWDFIAVYAQWGLWVEISADRQPGARLHAHRRPVYAHKCGVLLARLADVYRRWISGRCMSSTSPIRMGAGAWEGGGHHLGDGQRE